MCQKLGHHWCPSPARWNLNQNIHIFIKENWFKNFCKMVFILSQSQCVNVSSGRRVTSWYGNTFRVTNTFSSLVHYPHREPIICNLDVSFGVSLNQLLTKQSIYRWIETQWLPCYIIVIWLNLFAWFSMKMKPLQQWIRLPKISFRQLEWLHSYHPYRHMFQTDRNILNKISSNFVKWWNNMRIYLHT